MAAPEQSSTSPQEEPEGRNWLPMVAGGLLVLMIVGAITVFGVLGRSRNANPGDRKMTGASVQVIFKNSLGEITQKETLPLTVVVPNSPYLDYGTIDRAPLAPGQSRDFRVTLENLTSDWDGQVPQMKVVNVAR